MGERVYNKKWRFRTMKRKFNWKALLVLLLIVVFALSMVACKKGGKDDDDGEGTGGATMEALEALFTALDKTLPKTTKDTSVISATADISLDTDLVIKTDFGQVALGDYVDGLKVSLAANLQKDAPEKNVIDASISLGDKTPIKVFSKGSIAYVTDAFTSDNAAATPVTYMVDVTAIDYAKYLDDLPGILGDALSGVNVADLKTMLLDLINGASLGSMLDQIIETKKTDTGYDLRVIVATEDEDHPGLAGTVASLLGGILGGLPESIKPIIDTVIPYVFGAGINDLASKTKDQVNELHIAFDVDKTSGAISGLKIAFTSGKQVTTTTGGLTLAISNLTFKAEENKTLTGKAVPENAVPLGAELKVDLDLGNDNLDMTATLQVAPSLSKEDADIETGIKLALTSVSLTDKDSGKVFDANDLSATYTILSDGQYAIQVDLAALYKAAYGEIPQGVYTTQYYFPINIGEFLQNLTSKKYVLVGMNGTGSHGVYEYLWLDSVTKGDAFLSTIKTEILKDTDLLAKIGAAYGTAAPTNADELVVTIADYWADGKEGEQSIKYVMAYPAAAQKTITFKAGAADVTIKAFVGDDLAAIAETVTATAVENKVLYGWATTEGVEEVAELDRVTGDVTLYPVFKDTTDFASVEVYAYDVATQSYVSTGVKTVVKGDVISGNYKPADIYGMNFAAWYYDDGENVGDLSKAAFPANVAAIYPVYKTVNEGADESIMVEGDDSAITALFTKTAVAEANKFALYTFTGETTDVMSLVLNNITTALDVIENLSIDVNTIAGILRQINDLGIEDTDTDAVAQKKIAEWIRYILSKADNESRYVKNYYYTATATEVTNAALAGEVTTDDGVENLSTYMNNLVDYTVYYRYLGIYGNLEQNTVVDTWQYGWTEADWTAYNAAASEADKVAKYQEIEAKAETNAKKGQLVTEYYEELALGYISGYLGDLGDITTVEEFLFAKQDGQSLTFSIIAEDTGRDATGFNIHIKLNRGTTVYADVKAHIGLINGDTIVPLEKTLSANALDFRAWDMSQIKDLKKDGKAVDLSTWSAADLAAFATESKVSNGTIVFRGEIYTYDVEGTTFQSAAVAALLDLNLKMSGQPQA